jgi:SAM-dependent methyltransferase
MSTAHPAVESGPHWTAQPTGSTSQAPSSQPPRDETEPRQDEIEPRQDEIEPRQDDIAPRQDEIEPLQDGVEPRQEDSTQRPSDSIIEPRQDPAQTQPPTGDNTTLTQSNLSVQQSTTGLQSVLHLEPDTHSNNSDTDSAFDGNSSTSTSLASSILHYEYSNGRRYHGYRSGQYVLPNDEQEQDRLDLLHHIFLLILGGKLYDAPIPTSPHRVLDIGTGTGIWAIDFADENPSSEVLGTDLSPIQPSWVPPNAKFYIDDAESEWVYPPSEAFDFIHCRTMSGSITDWERLIGQCYTHLTPGGWLEFQEPLALCESDDGTIAGAENMLYWQGLCNDAAASFQKEIRVGNTLKMRMEKAGFVDVHEKVVKVCFPLPHFWFTVFIMFFSLPLFPSSPLPLLRAD